MSPPPDGTTCTPRGCHRTYHHRSREAGLTGLAEKFEQVHQRCTRSQYITLTIDLFEDVSLDVQNKWELQDVLQPIDMSAQFGRE